MAKNPEWCQPLSRWKTYYRKWIVSDDPAQLLNANIFFDFRLGYGSQGLVDSLHEGLFNELSEWPGLLRHMARNTLSYRPPLGFFGNFVLNEKGEGKGGLNIKSAMRLVVDFGRTYAMQAELVETNTIRRIEALCNQNRLKKEERDDLIHAYDFLMHQRLKHQSQVVEKNGGPPDNLLHPDDLTTLDQQALKEAFKQIRIAQARMRLDFLLYFP
jgi:CBS domain-containing protein